jgi:hypothetical protein
MRVGQNLRVPRRSNCWIVDQNERFAEINTALTFGAKHSSKRSTKVLPSTVSKPLSCPLLQSCMVFSNVALLCP